jgi:hypothetical protein
MIAFDPLEVAQGTSDADAFLIALRGILGDGDELYRFLVTLRRERSDDRLRGACARLQKAIERAR